MKINKIIIFAGLLIVLIMTYSLYILFSGNSFEEYSVNKIITFQPEPTFKLEETIVAKVVEPNLVKNDPNVISLQQSESLKKEEAIVGKSLESQERIFKSIEPSKIPVYTEKKKTIEKGSFEKSTKEKDYQPIYDHAIVRSTAKAYFLLQDAKSKLLEPKIVVKARIWRNIRNELWLEDEAVYNHEKSMIECEGVNGQGIEPGYYSVEVDGGGYGVLKFKFSLKKDEELNSTYFMPNYSKVIAVQFEDRDDKNAEYTRSQPLYKWNANVAPFSEYESKKSLLLKNPPSFDSNRYRSVMRGCGARGVIRSDSVYQTENGRYYLRVFSGQEGQINYEYKDNEGPNIPFAFESKFEDKLETITIQLNERLIVEEDTKIQVINKSSNTELIGINKNIFTKESPAFQDKFDYSLKGFSYNLRDPEFPLQLEYKLGSNSPRMIKGDNFLFQQNFNSYCTEKEISVRLVDSKAFKSPWVSMPLEEGIVSFKEAKFNLKEFKVNFLLSPTFMEMAKDFSAVTSEEGSFQLLSKNKNLSFTSLFNTDDKSLEENLSKLSLSVKSSTGLEKTINGEFNPNGYIRGRGLYEELLSINANDIIHSPNHEIEIAPIQKTLILRAINSEYSGLPWVEASLVAFEDLNMIIEIQRAFHENANQEYLNSLKGNEIFEMALGEEETSDNKLKFIFPKKETYDYFLNNGSWYNTSAKSVSDSKGYLVLKSEELIPGKKYTLFLWSHSQDDLKPDKEVSFFAKEGITDLGAILFD